MIELENAHSPVRISETKINVIAKFAHFPTEIEFTADENDVEEHGRDIYQRANNGEFGIIEE